MKGEGLPGGLRASAVAYMTTAAASVSSARRIDVFRVRLKVRARCRSIISASGITMLGLGDLWASASTAEPAEGAARYAAFRSPSSIVTVGCLRSCLTWPVDDSPSAWKERDPGAFSLRTAIVEGSPCNSKDWCASGGRTGTLAGSLSARGG